jgi:hypothetical protein
MKRRHPNHRLVKINRNYTVEEIAKLFGIHKNTVRHWVKNGLDSVDDKRPILILGHVLITFLQTRRLKNKQTCRPGELYCVRCHAPKMPAGGMVEYTPITDKFGNLVAICSDCNSIMNRRISIVRISELFGNVDISFPEAFQHIKERDKPSVNSDLIEGTSDHEKAQPSQ